MRCIKLQKPKSTLVLASVAVIIGVLCIIKLNILSKYTFSEKNKATIFAKHFVNTRKSGNVPYDVLFLFDNSKNNERLQVNFKACVQSLVTRTSRPLIVHIAGGRDSFDIAEEIFKNLSFDSIVKVIYHDKNQIEEGTLGIISSIHKQLSAKKHHFSAPLFYLSIVIHKVMLSNLSRLILLDVDLIFKSDIVDLFSLFENFKGENVIGIARENQPVYRHVFWQYRKEFPGTRIGEPPPHGLTGFNSGVVLFELDKMRQSSRYNSFFSDNVLMSLARKYKFQGHLGDQDFFTLLSFDNESLFYILPCGWNRQLCTWWKRDDMLDVFDKYYKCDEPIHIWHGNCRTSLQNYTSHSN